MKATEFDLVIPNAPGSDAGVPKNEWLTIAVIRGIGVGASIFFVPEG